MPGSKREKSVVHTHNVKDCRSIMDTVVYLYYGTDCCGCILVSVECRADKQPEGGV